MHLVVIGIVRMWSGYYKRLLSIAVMPDCGWILAILLNKRFPWVSAWHQRLLGAHRVSLDLQAACVILQDLSVYDSCVEWTHER